MQPDDLAEIERGQLRFLIVWLWGIYEKSYYAHAYGIIGSDAWRRFEVQLCDQRTAMDRSYWENSGNFLTPNFIEYVETLCDDAG